ncbi:MAG: histidine phosphatase family protein [Prevotella sp.]|nr:histidine phosphatase family protein [Prevotella sp.]
MTTLYLVRHGETIDNARQIMQGQVQGELNDVGIAQAEEVRDKLLKEHFDVFISSDLKRSIDTCQIIATPHRSPVKTTPLLRERDWGSFTGRYIPDLKDAKWPDDVESLDALKARAKEFLEMLKRSYPDQRVLAVGHGIINKAIQSVFLHKPMNEIQRMANAEIRILVL